MVLSKYRVIPCHQIEKPYVLDRSFSLYHEGKQTLFFENMKQKKPTVTYIRLNNKQGHESGNVSVCTNNQEGCLFSCSIVRMFTPVFELFSTKGRKKLCFSMYILCVGRMLSWFFICVFYFNVQGNTPLLIQTQ